MASTPLYKKLKDNGTTFYCFPGAAEDISAAYQNQNYKMYFSKYALLNFPKQNLQNIGGTQATPVYWDFDVFKKSSNASISTDYSEQLVESLRNYVANQEVVIKESKLNNSQYYYDNNEPYTTTEKLFWKWCKKLNVIQYEPASPSDEYFSNLDEFSSANPNDDTYFPEYLWKEREIIDWPAYSFYESSNQPGYLEAEFYATTNFRVGDIVKFTGITALTNTEIPGIESGTLQTTVTELIAAGATQGQKVIFDIPTNGLVSGTYLETDGGSIDLVYNRLVQYIGEVNGINNVQESNRSYTEVYALVPDHTGQTPDILFRLHSDNNYKPNLTFPIIPSQYQPEIMGAELFTSPIVNTPQNYPGSYFGQFDTEDFTYEVSNGDSIRRSGDYYGVSGDTNNPVIDGSTVDGSILNFNTTHYVKMNIDGGTIQTFDQFNAMEVDNAPPKDFEFNAILWYYTIQDTDGNVSTNLYGISFLDNPLNNPVTEEIGLKLPIYKKLVSNGVHDGTSYAFSLNLSFNIINDNPQDAYNPNSVNTLFGMDLFNTAMTRLASINDTFLTMVAENTDIKTEIDDIRQLLYTQTDLDTINAKIKNLENLLILYKTNQLQTSDTIKVVQQETPSFTVLTLENIDTGYKTVTSINTTDLYTTTGIIPININVPENKDFFVNIINNDEVNLTLPNEDRLVVVLDRDLDYRQSCQFVIDSTSTSTQNKKIDIYIKYTYNPNSNISAGETIYIPNTTVLPVETPLITNIDLPVAFNSVAQRANFSYVSDKFNFDVDLNNPIILNAGSILQVPLNSNYVLLNNTLKAGDTLMMNDLLVGTTSVFNFSGQYDISSIGTTSSYIYLDISTNSELVAYGASATLPKYIHDPNGFITSGTYSTELSNIPYFSLNKGYRFTITRISDSDISSISDRYLIQTEHLLK
jgi:hypothetical protein